MYTAVHEFTHHYLTTEKGDKGAGNLAEHDRGRLMAETIELSKTQQRVFDYMADFGSITTLQAFTDLGESRLSARIFELQKKGVHISGEIILVKNRYGEPRRVKRYYIG